MKIKELTEAKLDNSNIIHHEFFLYSPSRKKYITWWDDDTYHIDIAYRVKPTQKHSFKTLHEAADNLGINLKKNWKMLKLIQIMIGILKNMDHLKKLFLDLTLKIGVL